MTLYQFRLLSQDEQATATWEGDYLLSRQENSSTVLLYKVHGFYVEVYYSNTNNQLSRFNAFQSRSRLALYFHPQLN